MLPLSSGYQEGVAVFGRPAGAGTTDASVGRKHTAERLDIDEVGRNSYKESDEMRRADRRAVNGRRSEELGATRHKLRWPGCFE